MIKNENDEFQVHVPHAYRVIAVYMLMRDEGAEVMNALLYFLPDVGVTTYQGDGDRLNVETGQGF